MKHGQYSFHEDFAVAGRFAFGQVTIRPWMLRFINAFAALTCLFFRPKAGISRNRYQIAGYQDDPVKITVYRPDETYEPVPCLVYCHGGAFMMREFGAMHKMAAWYARYAGIAVAFVHYRLAPAYPFPHGVEDCYKSLLWCHDRADRLVIDPQQIAVGGDSAGGGLAAALALMARDRGGPPLRLQMLIYPALDDRLQTWSSRYLSDVPGWNAHLNAQMWPIYLTDGDFGQRAYAAPARADDFTNLPPAFIETEEFDCLRDEGDAYAETLRGANVPVEHHPMKGTFHGYDSITGSQVTQAALAARSRALRAAFGLSAPDDATDSNT